MRIIMAAALAAAFLAVQPAISLAMGDSMAGPSNGMKMAKCPAGDPAVILNTTKKTYMLDNQKNRTAMAGMMAHDKFICKSQAVKMGGKMAAAPKTHNKM